MGSGYEKTAKEHMVLSGLENYIEDTIEYSDTILSIHNDVEDVKQTAEDNHRYAMEHINDDVVGLSFLVSIIAGVILKLIVEWIINNWIVNLKDA